MLSIQEQITAASRSALENQFVMFSSVTNAAVDGWGKLFDLNLNTAKTSLEESSVIYRQLLEAKTPQEAFSFMAALFQPTTEKAFLYTKHLANIASNAQTELARVAETQIAEANRRASSFVQEAAKNAPPGTGDVMSIVKTAMENAGVGYEQFSRTAKQANDTMEANLNSTIEQFSQAAEKAPSVSKGSAAK